MTQVYIKDMSTAAGKPLDTARGKRTDPYYVAQDILSRRDNSVHEMQTKLKSKGFSSEQITKVIEWLANKKLLNDELFAQRYITSTIRGKAVGPRWLSYKLKQRGISEQIIEETLTELVTPDVEKELVQRAAASWRRLSRHRHSQHPKHTDDKQRLQRFLTSRGFSSEAIDSVT